MVAAANERAEELSGSNSISSIVVRNGPVAAAIGGSWDWCKIGASVGDNSSFRGRKKKRDTDKDG